MRGYIHQLDEHLDPHEVFRGLSKTYNDVVFLSSDTDEDDGWSILSWDPVQRISFDGEVTRVDEEVVNRPFREIFSEILEIRRKPSSCNLPFIGGAIGSIDYELGYIILDLPCAIRRDKIISFAFYEHALVYDHSASQWYSIGGATFPESRSPETGIIIPDLEASWDRLTYAKHFRTLKEYIRIGEIYQACLTFPFFGSAIEDTRSLFSHLCSSNPAPMAAYLEQGTRTILSLSPERFIRWDGSHIETRPIKGTRPRGTTADKDESLRLDLLVNEKEQAELNMITDLMRNDLNTVSKPGTVRVHSHRSLQACPSVWHSYSEIVAETRDGIGAWDIIEAMFPGGSISGCPKRRAVEILSEIEDQSRGIYSGCIGYISDNGRMDMSIAIRTLEQYENQIQASFGGGIVYESEVEQEYKECFDKAKPFLS